MSTRGPDRTENQTVRSGSRSVVPGIPIIFSMKVHHGGKFASRPNRKYVSSKGKYDDIVNLIKYVSKHKVIEVYIEHHESLVESLDGDIDNDVDNVGDNKQEHWGKDDDIVNLIKYVSKHKVIKVYIEHHESLVESLDGDTDNDVDNVRDNEQGIEGDNEMGNVGDNEQCIDYGNEGDNEMGSDEGSDGDNDIDNEMGSDEMGSDHSIEMVVDQGDEKGSEYDGAEEEFSDHDDDNIVDEEHIINELEVYLEGFRFTVDEDLVPKALHPEVMIRANYVGTIPSMESQKGIRLKDNMVINVKGQHDHDVNVRLPEAWFHPAYRLETCRQQYSFNINRVNERNLWEKNKWPTTLLPPKVVVPVGRPPKKGKRSVGEVETLVKGGKMGRKGLHVTCQNCKGKGHNKRGCKANASDQRQPNQGTPGTPSATRAITGTPATTSATRAIVGTPSATKASASTPAATSSQKNDKEEWIVLEFAKINQKPNNICTRSEATKKSRIMKQVFIK
nr:hypothetical protein [Tanacetum cinerariifolium]